MQELLDQTFKKFLQRTLSLEQSLEQFVRQEEEELLDQALKIFLEGIVWQKRFQVYIEATAQKTSLSARFTINSRSRTHSPEKPNGMKKKEEIEKVSEKISSLVFLREKENLYELITNTRPKLILIGYIILHFCLARSWRGFQVNFCGSFLRNYWSSHRS